LLLIRPQNLLCFLLLSISASCGPKHPPQADKNTFEVQFRPDPEVVGTDAQWLLREIPNATWDKGLHEATRILIAASRDRRSQLTPSATVTATANAGYPGHAKFFRELTGGGPPLRLSAQLLHAARQRNQPVDVAVARRAFGDGTVLWIGGIAHRPVLLDPIPARIQLDQRIPISIEVLDKSSPDALGRIPDPILFITSPHGIVQTYALNPERARWIDDFHLPGRYLMEVVARGNRNTQVVLKWAVFVDESPEELKSLGPPPKIAPNPIEATHALYKVLNAMRVEAGLSPIQRFKAFEPLAREHAALMASTGIVSHQISGVSPGVASKAGQRFHPGAKHYENLAAAPNWKEAFDIVRLSPGHLSNLMCDTCTHASIGVALEPVTDRTPRIFVVWELLEFPHGPPAAIPKR